MNAPGRHADTLDGGIQINSQIKKDLGEEQIKTRCKTEGSQMKDNTHGHRGKGIRSDIRNKR